MPELPEVETVRRSLIPAIKGAVITDFVVYHPDVFIKTAEPPVIGSALNDIRRRGKYLLFDLTAADGTPILMIAHLRMTGKMLLSDIPTEPRKHTHVRFNFSRSADADRDIELDFNDTRRFGKIEWLDADAESRHPGLNILGPEPLSDDWTADDFIAQCKRHPKTTIKSVLLNQSVVAGIGNIYADESLFRAGIHPATRVGRISQKNLRLLHRVVKETLSEAIGHRGTSFRDYVDGFGKKGGFQLMLHVYKRDGEPCHICDTPIKKARVAGRGTHFCPKCQKRY